MKRMKKYMWGQKLVIALASLVLMIALGLGQEQFTLLCHAQSQGKITVESANIRKNADGKSEVIGSAAKNAKVTINKQVTASDNTVWYQVFVDAETLGYIRSDLVSITDGTTPPKGKDDASSDTKEPEKEKPKPQKPSDDNTQIQVTEMDPMIASVTGTDSVRVRFNASTNSSIVGKAQKDTELVVTGQATGTDNKLWYRVKFSLNNKEISGFIRSDYVKLSGELAQEPTEEPVTEPEIDIPQEPEVPEISKDWDTQFDDDKWYLIDNVGEKRYKIDDVFGTLEDYQKRYASLNSKVKTQTVVIVLFVMLSVGLGGVCAFLFFKLKDFKDTAYFSQVERETIRRRTADRPGNGARSNRVIGNDKVRAPGRRPAGSAPTGRPAGSAPTGRPTGSAPTGRPAGSAPTGRPAGSAPTGRPAGSAPTGRPAGSAPTGRPAGSAPMGRPVGSAPTGRRPVGNGTRDGKSAPQQSNGEIQRSQSISTERDVQNMSEPNDGWKSKNFMTEDDEFEFNFLNLDGNE